MGIMYATRSHDDIMCRGRRRQAEEEQRRHRFLSMQTELRWVRTEEVFERERSGAERWMDGWREEGHGRRALVSAKMAEKMNAGERQTRDTLHYFFSGVVGMHTLWCE